MREAIGGTWLFGLVITFIVFFASFLAISINYSKAFNVKNNIVDLLGKYEGNNCNARRQIGNYLSDIGYLVPGPCPTSSTDETNNYVPYDLSGNKITSGNRGYYCVANEKITSEDAIVEKNYYRVIVFFKFDLPIVGDLTTFKVKGETESIYFPNESDICG